jgi:hypothetical protein
MRKSTVLSPEPFSVPLSSSPAWARLTDQQRSAKQRFDRVFESQLSYLRGLRASKRSATSEVASGATGTMSEEHSSKHPILSKVFGLGSSAVAAVIRMIPQRALDLLPERLRTRLNDVEASASAEHAPRPAHS